MKRIGYIFLYQVAEKKGILVHGKWKVEVDNGLSKKECLGNQPIVFSDAVCLGEVKTGQLVYFELDDQGEVYDIERASLANLDIVFLKELITSDNELAYENNTTISYEKLQDTEEYLDISELRKTFGILREREIRGSGNRRRIVRFWNDSKILNIMDLSLWVDEDVLSQHNYYGKNLEEIQILYDLFVKRKRIGNKGEEIYPKRDNDIISPVWKLLLAKFSNEDLSKILKIAPILQPALPSTFCKRNLTLLSDTYGMPSKELCKDYCTYKVQHASTATEYKDWSNKLYVFANCKAQHLPGEGVPMCSMGKEFIGELEGILEKQYVDNIESSIINRINDFLQTKSFASINKLSKEELLSIGVFLDALYALKSQLSKRDASLWSFRLKRIVKSYHSLDIKLQKILSKGWCNYVNDSLLEVSRIDDISPLSLGLTIELIKDNLTDNTKSEIIANVNDRFANVSDFSDLRYAFEYGYITGKQFSEAVQRLTINFTTIQLARFITNKGSETGGLRFVDMPKESQKYVMERIVELYDAKKLSEGELVRVSDFNGFYNLEDFIRWLTELKSGQYGAIDQDAVEAAITKAVEPLSEQEITQLFDKKFLVKSGESIDTLLNQYCDQMVRDMKYQNYKDSLYDDDSYSQYCGSWAHEEGYSDDDIDTIFDGDPDAYWNID